MKRYTYTLLIESYAIRMQTRLKVKRIVESGNSTLQAAKAKLSTSAYTLKYAKVSFFS